MKSHPQKGFTLVEVLIATMLLVIGISIISSAIAKLTARNFYSHRHTQAVIIAQNKIEELINEGYESPLLDDDDYENPLNPVTVTGDSSGMFYQYWTIDDLHPIPKSKQILSKIQWVSMEGETKTVILTAVCINQGN